MVFNVNDSKKEHIGIYYNYIGQAFKIKMCRKWMDSYHDITVKFRTGRPKFF